MIEVNEIYYSKEDVNKIIPKRTLINPKYIMKIQYVEKDKTEITFNNRQFMYVTEDIDYLQNEIDRLKPL